MMKKNCKSIPYQQNHEPMTTMTHQEKYGAMMEEVNIEVQDMAKPATKVLYEQKKTG